MQSQPVSSTTSLSGPLGKYAFVLWVALFNCLISLGFWAGRHTDPVLPYIVIGNGIGFTAVLLSRLLNRLSQRRLGLLPRVLIVAPVSVVAGVEIAALTVGHVPSLLGRTSLETWLGFAPTFVVAAIILAAFSMFYRSAQIRAALETERREAAELRQSETAARLALLQAQIEPHFLFNTLANVQSLIERDPARATTMLDSLNRYLRASLGRTRKPVSTLNEELELVEALLKIASMRLGDRLRYEIAVPEPLRQLTLPPLLLQPLVENALLHGIEPAIDGGEIRIVGKRDGDVLELSVTDTGVGLGNSVKLHGGVGLSNVRARLKSLYGDDGSVSVGANAARGVTATLLIPIR